MKLRKFIVIVAALLLCFTVASCKKDKEITCPVCGEVYNEKDGHECRGKQITCPDCGEIYYENEGHECGGGGEEKEYEPKWKLNAVTFDGKGMDVKILVLPVSEFNPYDPGYNGNDRNVRRMHQRAIEAEYNINIKYEAWDSSASWGPERVKYIQNGYLDKSLQNKGYYIMNIASQWIPSLVKSDALAPLYNLETRTGNFDIVPEYEQNETISEASSVKSVVYGYNDSAVRPDSFMYYNTNLVEEAGMEDPAELWFKGEWTVSKFEEWARQAQTNLGDGKKVLALGYPEFVFGMVASTGNKLVQTDPAMILFGRQTVTNVFGNVQKYFQNGWYDTTRGSADVAPSFVQGNSIFAHGEFWFIKNTERFNPNEMTFTLGVVPYPTADGQGGVPQYTTNPDEAIAEFKDGTMVSSLDLSNSSFKVPYTGGSCFSVLNVNNGQNGINSRILTNIIVDLYSGIGKDPLAEYEPTPEEAYHNWLLTKFDREIDVAVVESVQGLTYYEMIEVLSMTVGDGSHFGPDAMWPLVGSIITTNTNPATKLQEVLGKYQDAMRYLGYTLA